MARRHASVVTESAGLDSAQREDDPPKIQSLTLLEQKGDDELLIDDEPATIDQRIDLLSSLSRAGKSSPALSLRRRSCRIGSRALTR